MNNTSRKINNPVRLKILFVFLLSNALTLSLAAQKFVIGIIPDTQVEVSTRPEMFISQMNWLAEKKDSLDMAMVLHVGDIVDFNNNVHYERASSGFDRLDEAGIPYAVCLGNHDTGLVGENSGNVLPGNSNANLRLTDKFNTYFPVQRFMNQEGRYEKNKSDNAYYTFRAGGLKWLVLSLEFCARPGVVEWANTIIPEYPRHNVIILTHSHLTAAGTIEQKNSGYGDLSPQQVFDMMIIKHPNIRFVFCGHTGTSTYRVDKGENGNDIYQILQDYQSQDAGGGYIRLVEIDPANGTINAKMYSPFYNKTKDDYSGFSLTGARFIGHRARKGNPE